MGRTTQSQQMRADDYALSEETKQLRDREQREITGRAYRWALDMVSEHRPHLDRLAQALLERETLTRADVDELMHDLEPVSDASRQIGVELDPAPRTVRETPELEPALRFKKDS
jgi:hypothetical protein